MSNQKLVFRRYQEHCEGRLTPPRPNLISQLIAKPKCFREARPIPRRNGGSILGRGNQPCLAQSLSG